MNTTWCELRGFKSGYAEIAWDFTNTLQSYQKLMYSRYLVTRKNLENDFSPANRKLHSFSGFFKRSSPTYLEPRFILKTEVPH